MWLLALAGCDPARVYEGTWTRSAVEATAFDPYGQVTEACLAVEEDLVLEPEGAFERIRRLSPASAACPGVDEAEERERGLWAVFEAEDDGRPYLGLEVEHYSYDGERDRDDVDVDAHGEWWGQVGLGERDGARVLYLQNRGLYLEVR